MATLDRWRSFLEAPKTLDLVEAELVGRDTSSPAPLLAGPCEVRMDTLQDFSFSMKAKSGSSFALVRAINQHYENMEDGTSRLRLRGKEANGTEWHCGWTMPRNIEFGVSPVVEGKLTSLLVNQPLATSASSTELIFHADHLHPLARVMGESRLKQKRLEVLGSQIEFGYDNKNSIVSITASHSDKLSPTFTERWLTEPLRIMFGQAVGPRLQARNIGHKAIVYICTQPRLDVSSWFSLWRDEKAESFFDVYSQLLQFIALAPNARQVEANQITLFYDELSQVTGASRWVIALTLAGCTEGMAKLIRPYVKEAMKTQVEAELEAAAELAAKIEALDAPGWLKKKATTALQPKGASTDRALAALAETGIITRDQLATWRELRNSVMHGKILNPYVSQEGDAKVLQLMAIVRSLTHELLRRSSS